MCSMELGFDVVQWEGPWVGGERRRPQTIRGFGWSLSTLEIGRLMVIRDLALQTGSDVRDVAEYNPIHARARHAAKLPRSAGYSSHGHP